MIRYTTTNQVLIVENIDLTDPTLDIYVTYKQRRISKNDVLLTLVPTSVSKSGDDTVLTVYMSQSQTALFKRGDIEVQINWIDSQGNRKATEIAKVSSLDNLYEEVI